jgi:uncharacterized protein YxjI
MGKDSKYHRYREAGEDVNEYNVAEFGRPARSLFTTTRFFTMHHHIDITDENGTVVYHSDSKILSLHDKTTVSDAREEIAYIERRLLSIHERHLVRMKDGTEFELSTELLHLIKHVINIEGLGWQIEGNIVGWNYRLWDGNGDIIAVISQKALSIHDKYCIDIYRPEDEQTVVAIVVALQHMVWDRNMSNSGGGGSSSNG